MKRECQVLPPSSVAESIRHLIDFLADLETRGIGFRSLTESIDTTSPGGRLVFHLFAALAQFERELIKERTNAGLAAARARGRRGGRPPRLTGDQVKTARRLYDQKELTVGQIGDVLGVSRTTIYRALDRQAAHAGTASIGRPSRRKVAPGQDMTRHGRLGSVRRMSDRSELMRRHLQDGVPLTALARETRQNAAESTFTYPLVSRHFGSTKIT